MASIKFKGHGTIETDYENARSIQEKWENWLQSNRRVDSLVKVGNFSGRLSQIDSISLIAESQSKDQGHLIKRHDEEYKVDREAKLKLSPDKRAQHLGMFKLFYWATTGKEPDERTRGIAIKFQTKYFEKFPNRTLVNPIIFKKIIPRTKTDLNAFESGALRLIERAVREDMIAAK